MVLMIEGKPVRMPVTNLNEIAEMDNEKYFRNALRDFEFRFRHRKHPCTYKGGGIVYKYPERGVDTRVTDFVIELHTLPRRKFEMYVDGELAYKGKMSEFLCT